jgi:hypothetical protein
MQRARSISLLAAATAAAGLLLAGSAPGADGTPVPSAHAPIVVGIDNGGGPYLTVYDENGNSRAGFLPYFDFTQGGINVATGDVDGDGKSNIVTVPGQGGRGEIRTFDGSGTRMDPTVLATASGCGTRIAVGDVTGDGKADLVTGFEHCAPNIQVFDGVTGKRVSFFGAFNAGGGNHGIHVAAGDVTGDGRAEVITGAGPGDAPTVRIFSGSSTSEFFPTPLRTIDAFDPSVTSGLEVAAADLSGDGKADVIVGAETPDDPQIKIFDGSTGVLRDSFRPFGLVSAGSLRVAAGDIDGDGTAEIVVGATINYLPSVKIFSADGTLLAELQAPVYNGRSLAVGDLDGDGKAEIVMSVGPGYDSSVVVFDVTGTSSGWFEAYGYSFTNGVRVAAGDLDGNGTLEYVTGQGPGGSELLVLDEAGNELYDLYPFGESWQGLYVAVGDVDGNAKADIVAGSGAWEEPRVKVYDGEGRELASFLAFDPEFQGGVRVATGDLDGDGKAEIVAGAGPGGSPVVRVFDENGQRRSSFYAFDPSYTGGIYVASGDLDGDGKAEIVVGAGAAAGSGGEVRVFDADGHPRGSFIAYEASQDYYDGVHVAVGDVNGDGMAEIVTGPGRVRPVDVKIFTGTGMQTGVFRANDEFQGGIYVAVPAPLGPRLTSVALAPLKGKEGHQLRLVGTFLDPSGGAAPEKFAASVSWGDGSSSNGIVAALGAGRYGITATNRYLDVGQYKITVRIADTALRAVIASTTATIEDAPLVARGRSIRSGPAFRGIVATVRDGDPLGLSSDLRAVITWGDGTHSPAVVVGASGRFRVLSGHHYARPGIYHVGVRIRSKGGSTARATSTIRVKR